MKIYRWIIGRWQDDNTFLILHSSPSKRQAQAIMEGVNKLYQVKNVVVEEAGAFALIRGTQAIYKIFNSTDKQSKESK
mgnify:CR=1 FL=1